MTLMSAAAGIMSRMHAAVTTDARPVLPPCDIPTTDSSTVVVFEVPNTAPTEVATESATRARSILVLNPPSPAVVISSSVNMPAFLPVPTNDPMVSNVSTRLNDTMATSASDILPVSEKSAGMPSDVKIAPNDEHSWDTASPKPTLSPMCVTPIGMPRRAMTAMAMIGAPRTLRMYRSIDTTRATTNSRTWGLARSPRAGVPPDRSRRPDSSSPT